MLLICYKGDKVTKKALKKKVQFRDNEIEYFELRNGALENELEAYRFMYIKAEDERLYLDNQYNSIKKTVIREFKTNKRLQAEILRLKEIHRQDKIIRFGSLYGIKHSKAYDTEPRRLRCDTCEHEALEADDIPCFCCINSSEWIYHNLMV